MSRPRLAAAGIRIEAARHKQASMRRALCDVDPPPPSGRRRSDNSSLRSLYLMDWHVRFGSEAADPGPCLCWWCYDVVRSGTEWVAAIRYPYGSVAAIQRKFVAPISKIWWAQPGAAVPFVASISKSHTLTGSRGCTLGSDPFLGFSQVDPQGAVDDPALITVEPFA